MTDGGKMGENMDNSEGKKFIFTLIFLALISAYSTFTLVDLLHLEENSQDINIFYTATNAMSEGANPYEKSGWTDITRKSGISLVSTFREGVPDPYLYTPVFSCIILPLTKLKIYDARIAWFASNQVMLLASVLLLERRWRMPRDFRLIGFLPFTYLIHLNSYLGQSSMVLLFLLSVSAYCMRARPRCSAAAGTAAAIIKPQLFPLLLAYTVKMGWPGRKAIMATVIGLTAFSSAIFGPGYWPQYAESALENSGMWMEYGKNFLAKTTGAGSTPAHLVFTALALSLLAYKAGDLSIRGLFAASITTSLILSPVLHGHHLLLLLAPAWIMLANERSCRKTLICMALLSLGLRETSLSMFTPIALISIMTVIIRERV